MRKAASSKKCAKRAILYDNLVGYVHSMHDASWSLWDTILLNLVLGQLKNIHTLVQICQNKQKVFQIMRVSRIQH